MQTFSIEQDYLGEFHDAVQYDFEETVDYQGEHPSTGFYITLAQQTGGPVLELACGTGRVTLPIARLGIPITGLDLAPAHLLSPFATQSNPRLRNGATLADH